jgi:hypothetical protein
LCASEKQALYGYLKQFGIRPAAAATLLIVRELRCKRLSSLKGSYSDSISGKRERVTAHPADGAIKQAFNEHAASLGMDPDPAASILFRAELKERWLAKSVESS